MNRRDLQENDVLVFKNGRKATLGKNNMYLLREFYDDELNCETNPEYTIQTVLRPEYKPIFERTNEKGGKIK